MTLGRLTGSSPRHGPALAAHKHPTLQLSLPALAVRSKSNSPEKFHYSCLDAESRQTHIRETCPVPPPEIKHSMNSEKLLSIYAEDEKLTPLSPQNPMSTQKCLIYRVREGNLNTPIIKLPHL